MSDKDSKYVDMKASININPDMVTHIGKEAEKVDKEPEIDPSKIIELSGHANVNANEIFGFANKNNAAPFGKPNENGQVTFGNVLQMMLGSLLFGQLMNQPVSEDMLKQLFTPPTDKKEEKK